ncbi:MAG: twin-arginine translocase subunit TatB [Nitrospirae bacterium]|nr:twin-arginine translocase subunit TatB [Nitrospirota bacterium]
MLDLGFQELIVIFVVAILVFGPKRLPELSRTVGKALRELKTAVQGVKESIDEVEDEVEGVKKDVSGLPSSLMKTESDQNMDNQKEDKEKTKDAST